MGFFRKLGGIFGFVKDDGHDVKTEDDHDYNSNSDSNQTQSQPKFQESGLPRRGFGVPVQVAVDRPQPGPVLLPCNSGDGGVQGLKWYAKRLRIDEDGDVADEFLNEVMPSNSETHQPKFELKYSTRPAKVKNQVLSAEGKIQQCVEYQGRLQWV